jgi:DNA-directed RNA polymerase specialized sigma24 family protein
MRAALLKDDNAMSEPAITAEATDATTVNPGTLRVTLAAAAYQARRVARTLKLSEVEREEAEHEILLVLLERRRFFDPARGPWTPFAHRIARQAAQSVADSLVAARRLYVSLDQPAIYAERDDDPGSLVDTLQDQAAPSEGDLLDAMSLVSFVAALPQELRMVAEAALEADGELAEAQRKLGLSTSEFYRRLREIRYRLFTIGLVDRRSLLDR